jgi:hypothetical protein
MALGQILSLRSLRLVLYGWGLGQLPLVELNSHTAHKDRMLRRQSVRKVLEREESLLVKS